MGILFTKADRPNMSILVCRKDGHMAEDLVAFQDIGRNLCI